jgi:hypothetical protein
MPDERPALAICNFVPLFLHRHKRGDGGGKNGKGSSGREGKKKTNSMRRGAEGQFIERTPEKISVAILNFAQVFFSLQVFS